MKSNAIYLNIDFWNKKFDELGISHFMKLFLLDEINKILNIYFEFETKNNTEKTAEYTIMILKSAYSIRKNKFMKIDLTYWDESFYRYGSYEFFWLTAEERLKDEFLLTPALNIRYNDHDRTKSYISKDKLLTDLKQYMKFNISILLEDILLGITPYKMAA